MNSPVPQNRFSLVGDDMVADASTGLTWSRDDVPGGRMDWSAAKTACAAFRLGGHDDWRLPTVRELLTLVDYERHDPAIDTGFFACQSSWYWTSTPAAASPGDRAWFVYFSYGLSYWANQSGDCQVRAVRASQ